MITCRKSANRRDYAPPLISNGELSVTLDYSGVQTKESVPAYVPDKVTYPIPEILMAGRRYAGSEWGRGLITYGFLSQDGVGEITDWEQSLSHETASIITKTVFDDVTITTEAFVAFGSNILALRKTFSEDCFYTLTYNLSDPRKGGEVPYEFSAKIEEDEIVVDYSVEGRIDFRGRTRFVCSGGMKPVIDGNKFSFTGFAKKGEPIDFFLIFSDNVRENDTGAVTWDTLCAEHLKAVKEYDSDGFAEIGDELIDNAYRTAAYHLRCVATPWGIPTGVFRTHWNSVYFAFDEFYMLDALLSSNHLERAKRSVDFRANGLGVGLRRAAYMERFPEKPQARYPWHSDEDGREISSPGYYNDHIFHMANIAIGAWEYYLHSGDLEYLRIKLYPVIRACAGYYHFNMVYRLNDNGQCKTVIGHCTDLERLGPSIMNAYMTTCSAIKLFRIFKKASELVGLDWELAGECAKEAEELYEGLPTDGEKYVAYPGYTGASVAVMTGTYPYLVHDGYNEKEHKAVIDYIERELTYGNMYATGKRICSWYSLWKAIYFIRQRKADEAYDSVLQSISESGAFFEMFEINEEDVSIKPWFSTASAYVVTAVDEMLLQDRDGVICLLPCVPEKIRDVRFRLSAHGGVTVGLEMVGGVVKKLEVSGEADEYIVEIPDRFAFDGKVVGRGDGVTAYKVETGR